MAFAFTCGFFFSGPVFNRVFGISKWRSRQRTHQQNADDADGRGSSRIKPEKICVNPLDPRHPRSINPYTDKKTALVTRSDDFQPEFFPRVSDSPYCSRLYERAAGAGHRAGDEAPAFTINIEKEKDKYETQN